MKVLTVIAYAQTGRTMFSGPVSMAELNELVNPPKVFDTTGGAAHGNRPIDKGHMNGIAEYLEGTERIVLNSVVVYARPDDVIFMPTTLPEGMSYTDAIAAGMPVTGSLQLKPGSKFDVGDGQHREGAVAKVLAGHNDADDPVYKRLVASGINLNIVLEDDFAQRQQDYVDLQKNAKIVSTSSAATLDSRHEINRLARAVGLKARIFHDPKHGPGQRLEYMSSSVGKTKPKLYTLQSLRYGLGTALIGFGQRSTRGWEAATDALLDNAHKFDVAELVWTKRMDRLADELPGWKDVDTGAMTIPEAREQFVSLTGAGFTALMGALFKVEQAGGDVEIAITEAAKLDWKKHKDGFFGGTLVNDENKVMGSRNAFEAGAEGLAGHLLAQQSVTAAARVTAPAATPSAVAVA